jgi:hypothetical protein
MPDQDPMTREASGAQFEIKVDGVVRSCRDVRETAIEAARFLQQRNQSTGDRRHRPARRVECIGLTAAVSELVKEVKGLK